MPKIIVVAGAGDTYKSTSIKAAMNSLGIQIVRPSTGLPKGDVLMSAHIHINGSGYSVGFASGGDTPASVATAINFFSASNLDYMIFACRGSAARLAPLTAFAATYGIAPIIIRTAKSPNPTAAVAATVAASLSHIP